MVIHELHDDKECRGIDLLRHGLSNIPEQNLTVNYHPHYSDNPANLFYLLKSERYKSGCYYVLEEDGQYIGSAGWNTYNTDIVLCLTRAYFVKGLRHRYYMAEHLLPKIFEQASAYNTFWITCNDYNKNIYDGLVRMHSGKSAGIFNSWPSIYKKFVPVGSKVVNNSVQYVAEYKR
jgi:hypothetical protein